MERVGNMDRQTAYRILGLRQGAPISEIKDAYDRKVKKLSSKDYYDDVDYLFKKRRETKEAYEILVGKAPEQKSQILERLDKRPQTENRRSFTDDDEFSSKYLRNKAENAAAKIRDQIENAVKTSDGNEYSNSNKSKGFRQSRNDYGETVVHARNHKNGEIGDYVFTEGVKGSNKKPNMYSGSKGDGKKHSIGCFILILFFLVPMIIGNAVSCNDNSLIHDYDDYELQDMTQSELEEMTEYLDEVEMVLAKVDYEKQLKKNKAGNSKPVEIKEGETEYYCGVLTDALGISFEDLRFYLDYYNGYYYPDYIDDIIYSSESEGEVEDISILATLLKITNAPDPKNVINKVNKKDKKLIANFDDYISFLAYNIEKKLEMEGY